MAAMALYHAEDGIVAPEFPSSPIGSELLRVRRARFFAGAAKAAPIVTDAYTYALPEETTGCGGAGLSQAALDAMCVGEESANGGSPSSDAFVGGAAQEELGFEEVLLRARRMRAFLGADKANAFASEIMSKGRGVSGPVLGLGLDGQEGTATSTASTRTSPHRRAGMTSDGGLSQAALDMMSTTDGGLSQAELDAMSSTDVGLSQAALDSLSVFETCSAEEPSSPGPDSMLLRIRRTRAFQGEDAVKALVAEAQAKEESANIPVPLSPPRKGKTQQQLNRLCVESPESCDSSAYRAANQVEQIATPQRKRRSLVATNLSPEPSTV